MAILSLNYRRPPHVDPAEFRKSQETASSQGSIRSGRSSASAGIPDALAFDKIISGGTCSPCSVRDFMNYLIYVERSAENLQFFLWYKDYVRRFHEAKTPDIALAPEWTQAMEDETLLRIQKEQAEKVRREHPVIVDLFRGTDFEKQSDAVVAEIKDPFGTPPRTPHDGSSEFSGSNTMTYREQASEAFAAAGVKQPFTIQPFREEVDRVITTYIMDDAPRQLNLSSKEQRAVLHALAYTTHPSALRTIVQPVEATLRQQAHPNFIRWSICNGHPERVCFAWLLGGAGLTTGTVLALVLTLSGVSRGYRALAAVFWIAGISGLVGAFKGICVILHGLHHRQVRPWELFTDCEEGGPDEDEKSSFDSFGSANSYEDNPWVVRFERRSVLRRVFDHELWVEEPALRQIQDTIFVQSVLAALVGASVLTAIFVAVPGAGLF